MESLNPVIEEYARTHSDAEPEILQELSRETQEKVAKPQMLSGHLQGRILSLFSKLIAPRKVLDIGTYTGYSAICLAEGSKEDGIVHTIDKNEELEGMAKRYFEKAGLSERIRYHQGNALGSIENIEGPFDIVFIDADKENYLRYYEQVFDQVPSGGLIMADNVLWKGKVTESRSEQDKITQALCAYNEHVEKDERVEKLILPVRDGISLARKK